MFILNFKKWSINEQANSFKVYYIPSKPKYKYRRSGARWQYQEKATSRKDIWHWVENTESISILTTQYNNNKSKKTTTSSSILPSTTNPKSYWTLITIIACENYPDNKQGMADVAQSIYNRYNISGQPYGKTIYDIILSKNQYQPVTDGIAKGAAWNSINTKSKAIDVYMKTKGVSKSDATNVINSAISAQSDKALIAKSKVHVGSRTEFLNKRPTSKNAADPIEREPSFKNNSFFWNYAGKTNYYLASDLTAKPRPSTVIV